MMSVDLFRKLPNEVRECATYWDIYEYAKSLTPEQRDEFLAQTTSAGIVLVLPNGRCALDHDLREAVDNCNDGFNKRLRARRQAS